jgi:hypothetical protein
VGYLNPDPDDPEPRKQFSGTVLAYVPYHVGVFVTPTMDSMEDDSWHHPPVMCTPLSEVVSSSHADSTVSISTEERLNRVIQFMKPSQEEPDEIKREILKEIDQSLGDFHSNIEEGWFDVCASYQRVLTLWRDQILPYVCGKVFPGSARRRGRSGFVPEEQEPEEVIVLGEGRVEAVRRERIRKILPYQVWYLQIAVARLVLTAFYIRASNPTHFSTKPPPTQKEWDEARGALRATP